MGTFHFYAPQTLIECTAMFSLRLKKPGWPLHFFHKLCDLKALHFACPPELGYNGQLLESFQTQRLLLSFLGSPLNASGPHPWAADFFLLWSPAAAHKGRSEERGQGGGGAPGWLKVVGLSLQPHFVSGRPPLPRQGQR